MPRTMVSLPELFAEDETAWLEAMAERIKLGAYGDLDYAHLVEYLTDMAQRDRREVESRLVVLLVHVLKWEHQPEHQSRSWQSTIVEQRQELARLASRGVLRIHAESVLSDVYAEAIERVAVETGLSTAVFPAECEYSIEELLSFDPIPAGP